MKWQLQTAKARLSELIRKVDEEGPQTITVRGVKEYVVVPKAEWDRRAANEGKKPRTALELFEQSRSFDFDMEFPPIGDASGLKDVDFGDDE